MAFRLPSVIYPITLLILGMAKINNDRSNGMRAKRLNAATSLKRTFDFENTTPPMYNTMLNDSQVAICRKVAFSNEPPPKSICVMDVARSPHCHVNIAVRIIAAMPQQRAWRNGK